MSQHELVSLDEAIYLSLLSFGSGHHTAANTLRQMAFDRFKRTLVRQTFRDLQRRTSALEEDHWVRSDPWVWRGLLEALINNLEKLELFTPLARKMGKVMEGGSGKAKNKNNSIKEVMKR